MRLSFLTLRHTQRHAQRPVCPDKQSEGQAIDGLALLPRGHSGEALNRHCKGLGKYRVIDEKIAALAREERAPSQFQTYVPRPISL
jgi:hypothetical protein